MYYNQNKLSLVFFVLNKRSIDVSMLIGWIKLVYLPDFGFLSSLMFIERDLLLGKSKDTCRGSVYLHLSISEQNSAFLRSFSTQS